MDDFHALSREELALKLDNLYAFAAQWPALLEAARRLREDGARIAEQDRTSSHHAAEWRNWAKRVVGPDTFDNATLRECIDAQMSGMELSLATREQRITELEAQLATADEVEKYLKREVAHRDARLAANSKGADATKRYEPAIGDKVLAQWPGSAPFEAEIIATDNGADHKSKPTYQLRFTKLVPTAQQSWAGREDIIERLPPEPAKPSAVARGSAGQVERGYGDGSRAFGGPGLRTLANVIKEADKYGLSLTHEVACHLAAVLANVGRIADEMDEHAAKHDVPGGRVDEWVAELLEACK